jgi:HAD superfamily hydrolase (TIGR01509 family)
MFVQAVVFDLFDTLVLIENSDLYYPLCFQMLYDSLVQDKIDVSFKDFKQVYDEVRELMLAETELDLTEPHFNVRVSRTLMKFGYDFRDSDPVVVNATKAFADGLINHLILDDDVNYVLKNLYGKYKLGLISNLRIPELGRELLKKYSLEEYFDVILISGEENVRKPNPLIFEKALKLLGVKASESVFIGDMLDLDVIGPKNVGMKTIFIKRRPLKNMYVKPDQVITQLLEVLDILK